MNHRRWSTYAGAAFLALSLAACGTNGTATQNETSPRNIKPVVQQPTAPQVSDGVIGSETPDSIKRLRQTWLDQNIKNYQYVIERQCFCTEPSRGPVKVEVRGDQIKITNVATGETVSEFFDDVNTITKIYDLLEKQANEGADEISVTRDATTAVPNTVKIDISYQMADEEQFYTISNFEVIS